MKGLTFADLMDAGVTEEIARIRDDGVVLAASDSDADGNLTVGSEIFWTGGQRNSEFRIPNSEFFSNPTRT